MFTLLMILLHLAIQTQPQELGRVSWVRHLEEAQKKAIQTNKPILILFQEVPGCSTCRNYGTDVLSHPLLVETIENYFIPLCIYNNKNGHDASVLSHFGEPAWNNPVVRIVDHQLKDIVGRLSGNYSVYGLVTQINTSLITKAIRIPEYLSILEEESKASYTGTETIYMQMYCFWSGERLYGHLKGVVATNAGFMKGHEVVEIKYDPKRINISEIIKFGKKNNIADKLYTNSHKELSKMIAIEPISNFRMDSENKYFLHQTDYKYIPMTPLQALRANVLLSEKQGIDHLFSSRQIQWLSKSKIKETAGRRNLISEDLIKSWYH